MPEGRGGDERSQFDPIGERGESGERAPRVERSTLCSSLHREVMIGSEQPFEATLFAGSRQPHPLVPGDVFLAFDHQTQPHALPPYRVLPVRRAGDWSREA
jgi:hypothetical protein